MSEVKNPPGKQEIGSTPGLERSPREENGNSLHYSYLGNPMDKGAWRSRVRHDLVAEQQQQTYLQSRNRDTGHREQTYGYQGRKGRVG